jgi:uncharacterized protein YkwD
MLRIAGKITMRPAKHRNGKRHGSYLFGALAVPLLIAAGHNLAQGAGNTAAKPGPVTILLSADSSAMTKQPTPAEQVAALINQARARAGQRPLKISVSLDRSAAAHNRRMAGGCGLSHQCPGERALGGRESGAGVHWTWAGENVGEGGPVPGTKAAIAEMAVTLTQDMLNEKPPEDGHRKNILSGAFHHIGIAVREDTSGTVWMTQDFSN